MSLVARFRRFVEDVLPWYDPVAERKHRAQTAALAERLHQTEPLVERIRRDYVEMDKRLRIDRR